TVCRRIGQCRRPYVESSASGSTACGRSRVRLSRPPPPTKLKTGAYAMLYRGMERAQLDAAYNNSAAVLERDAIVADWAARSAKVRREIAGHLDLAYGDTPRERLDLFLAADPDAPTLAFIHGGYWQINDLI